MKTKKAYANLNGKILPLDSARVSVMDRGFLYGDGVYETIRVYQGAAFDFMEHARRLVRSAKAIGLKPPVSNAVIHNRLKKIIKKSGLQNGTARVWLTRGEASAFGFDPQKAGKPTLLVSIAPSPPLPESLYRKGVTALVSSVIRNSPRSIPPSAKTTNGLNGILAIAEAKKFKAFEALMLASKGNLVEGSVSNVFVVQGKKVITPQLDGELLPGVTRKRILKILRKLKIPVIERRVWPKDLMKANEIFISNAYLEALGVRRCIFSPGLGLKKKAIQFSAPKIAPLVRKYYHPASP